MVRNINSLDSSDGRVIGYDPQDQEFNPPSGIEFFFY